MRTITGAKRYGRAPRWAELERTLIDRMNASAEPLLAKYVHPDGTILWPTTPDHTGIDALDDAYESFHNWPLFYMIGGDDRFLAWSQKEFDAITRQFGRYDCGHGHPMVVNEYEQGYDWFHQAEGYLFFYLLCMAAGPGDARNRERAKRFAGLYMNEDPAAPNYDEALNLIRGAHTGSMGPAYRNFTGEPWLYEEWKKWWGLPFHDIPGVTSVYDLADPHKAALMGKAIQARQARGDVPVNIGVTTMAANAWLLTGEEKYAAWTLRYIDGWLERVERNGGIVPDNVGLGGMIGEHIDGKWYGGYYGWTWPHGWDAIGNAMIVGAENGYLVSGDERYLELLRSQLDVLIARGVERDGLLHVPHKYGDPGATFMTSNAHAIASSEGIDLSADGWFEFRPAEGKFAAHLWYMSQRADDLERLKRMRNPQGAEWTSIGRSSSKNQGGHETAWIAYLEGRYPDYPEAILTYNLEQVGERLLFMETDAQDPAEYKDWYLQVRNPITAEGLVNLTMGGLQPEYNGGLPMVRLMYYDVRRSRPGLPLDVGALVSGMDAASVTVTLVNLHPTEERELIVRAGAYGEHRFTSAIHAAADADAVVSGSAAAEETFIGDSTFKLRLLPGCEWSAVIGMERFVGQPCYAGHEPWGAAKPSASESAGEGA